MSDRELDEIITYNELSNIIEDQHNKEKACEFQILIIL